MVCRISGDTAFYFMNLIVNGEIVKTSATTVKELLGELGVLPDRVAVEVNLLVIRKAEYPVFLLKEQDRVEIVNFVGGGQGNGRRVYGR
ncbi:MAG TPA: sulfur carrier protein ThiS [Thermodesulfovibrionales bacterium]|nr:sulfur carrier protein ThiS [Thermodesulfovibrionales bacterium]